MVFPVSVRARYSGSEPFRERLDENAAQKSSKLNRHLRVSSKDTMSDLLPSWHTINPPAIRCGSREDPLSLRRLRPIAAATATEQ